MKVNSNLSLKDISSQEKEHIKKLFELEDKNFNERAHYEILEEGDMLVFKVEAQDAVALRAALNAITKTLSIYERTGNLIEE